MIAAVYARKSTEQVGADADAKSTARQIENVKAFAAAHGWTVPKEHVYADDAISGAETKKLVNRQRLIDAIGRRAVQVIVMRDASRFSRRDGHEAFGELQGLAQTGVAIWFYADNAQFTFGSFGENVVGFVRAEMNAEYRRQIAKWTKEAMVRKAQAGHVTGGVCFGYDNVPVDGHVERRINKAEAKVVRRIFDLCIDGHGYTGIAKQLNAERALTPTPRRGRPSAWSPSTVLEVLRRELYIGRVVYNKTRRRAPDGSTTYADRPQSEWLRFERPELRIIPADVWSAARARLDGIRAHLAKISGGRNGRRRRDIESPYLLSGFTRCATCGGAVGVLDKRYYGCIGYHKRGTTVCGNSVKKPVAALDAAVLDELRGLLHPKGVMAIVDRLLTKLAPQSVARNLDRLRQELKTVERQITNLTRAIAQGGPLPSLLADLKARHARRDELTTAITTGETRDAIRVDRPMVERKVREYLSDWQAHLTPGRRVDRARQTLRELLATPLTLTPEGRSYRFEGEALLGARLLGRLGLPTFRESPRARHLASRGGLPDSRREARQRAALVASGSDSLLGKRSNFASLVASGSDS